MICTRYHENFSRQEALNAGIRKFIQNPITGTELFKAVREGLDGCQVSSKASE